MSTLETVSKEMPKYQSHKKVWALKIKSIVYDDNDFPGAEITPEDDNYSPFRVDSNYVAKHITPGSPRVGGYFVQYAGGYPSWSPADAFESGYTLVDNT